ncbi:hypothetical protein [Hymenobacter arizonensis]|uniref:Uncharacterized protein n=1 Tax=Hymenobacter arizonensis TaxID=1227077 RepID=A0A1I5YSS2_HYMAR|nr:hypothetical protein [Hymenobacter arizonensis]SFQ47150.1 hypothetical protein SAMN04515668_2409 [Hymenobacter arizonensis]
MQIYNFWARETAAYAPATGEHYDLVAYAGSNLNQADATAQARQKLLSRQDRLESGERLNEYPAGAKPLREKLEQRLYTPEGKEMGAITRNAYGALVLNTSRLMFVDVDLVDLRPRPELSAGLFTELLRWLRIIPTPPPVPPIEPLPLLEAKVQRWLQQHPAWHFRLYRTRAGYRLLATHAEILPTDAVANQVFTALGADEIYARMCRLQACYRARLTPKPWRIGLARPTYLFPYQDAEQLTAQADWESTYTAQSADFSVCEFIGDYGSGQVCPAAKDLLALHDAACLGSRTLA